MGRHGDHGLEDGRAALYLRAHHVLTDGLGGIRLLGLLLDEPRLAAGDAATVPSGRRPSRDRTRSRGRRRRPGTMTMTSGVTVRTVVRRVTSGVNAARDVDPVEPAVGGVQQRARRRQLGVPTAAGHRRSTGGVARRPLTAQPARDLLGRQARGRRPSLSGAAATTC